MKFLILFLGLILFSCANSKNHLKAKSEKSMENNNPQTGNTLVEKPVDFSASPFAIIYKTKKDYDNKVPVLLNDEKNKIVSYPAIKDIFFNGKLALPDKLSDGFLLDNRGIYRNVAFLNITYEEYSKMTKELSLVEMMKLIIDKDPISEMYNCGSRYQYKNIVLELNKFIEAKQLNKFKKIF